jgi:hypothetical protein
MIDQAIHMELEEKWLPLGKVYQKWSRIERRLPVFLSHINYFEGRDVLELGCNAGVYGFEISKVAKSYFGVDATDHFIRQANITKRYIKNPEVEFWLGRVKDFIEAEKSGDLQVPYNALFASFLLYHLSNKEIALISKYVLPKCDVVILPVRTKKRKPWRLHNLHFFYKPENVKKYLAKNGFKCQINWTENNRSAVVIGQR